MTKECDTSAAALAAPSPVQVERAIRCSYAQMMLGAVFGASTGGMFLVGFAMKLGADNVVLGLLSTVPQFFVVFQFGAAFLVERGWSRKRITFVAAVITPLCWFFIAAIPLLGEAIDRAGRLTVLIGVISLVTIAAQFAGNARGSWVGDLVPVERRGRFFGYCSMFAGVVGAIFAVAEGRLLDVIQSHGLLAFGALFFFGSAFGLATALLHLPQPDCPLPSRAVPARFFDLLGQALRQRPFVALALVHAVIALGSIAGPFVAAYALRDLGMSYFGLGLVNAVGIIGALLASPLLGRLVDRFGCRPILILGLLLMAPCGLIWLAIPPGAWRWAYWLLPWANFISGVGSAAVGIAISTMIYKTSSSQGRSVQFAAYGVFVTLVAAPMPLLGGWLVSHLAASGHAVDLRLTFYAWTVFMFAAAALAGRLTEPGSAHTRTLVFNYFPRLIAAQLGLRQFPPIPRA